jgi:hypothetical protein
MESMKMPSIWFFSAAASLALSYGFCEEPGPALSLIYPVLDEARRRNVVVFATQFVSGAQVSRLLQVVFAKLAEHSFWRHVLGIFLF